MEKYVIGLDFGSDSVRAMLVSSKDGRELSTAVAEYPRWKKRLYCDYDNNQFRQHPLDYVECMEEVILGCLAQVGKEIASNVVGISMDTTGSTPVAVNKEGTPLALLPEFQDNPNAMFILWKDNTAVHEAEEINSHSEGFAIDYLKYVGGIYSAEWFWAKMLHIIRIDEQVREQAYTWVEHCDWMPFLLTGGKDVKELKRSVCAAGHKCLWSEEFGGFPPNDFFKSLDPLLDGAADRLPHQVYSSDHPAGKLSTYWAEKLGLSTDVVIGVGAFDCHMGAVGGQIEPYYLSKVIGTSTCDILVAPKEDMKDNTVRGICGQVDGSVIPGMIGLEAGQSSFGDTFAWFKKLLIWPLQWVEDKELAQKIEDNILNELNDAASKLTEHREMALDWLNGRRTPDANQWLKSAVIGLNLSTRPEHIYQALVEAACFGAKAIADRFIEEGIPVRGLIALGGIPKKSPYIMQTMADVSGMTIKVHSSEQTCALGAAMFAATAAGVYDKVEEAMKEMGQGFEREYLPDADKHEYFQKRYQKYQQLGGFIETEMTK